MEPHIKAELYLLTSREGGRSHPIYSEYRPSFRYRNLQDDVVLHFTDRLGLQGGEQKVAQLTFLTPNLQSKQLFIGLEFDLTEGDRRVATGIITEVFAKSMLGDPAAPILPFLSEQHPRSKRSVIFEDDGKSSWLYLTEGDNLRPVSDAWVYNRILAPNPSELDNFRPGPPPAPIGYTDDSAICSNPESSIWKFIWSEDGDSVSLLKDEQSCVFLTANSTTGYSRNLLTRGPWGKPWNEKLFCKIFGQQK